jgi:hypothetical protein
MGKTGNNATEPEHRRKGREMEPAFLNKLSELLSIRQKRCGTTKNERESVINETS